MQNNFPTWSWEGAQESHNPPITVLELSYVGFDLSGEFGQGFGMLGRGLEILGMDMGLGGLCMVCAWVWALFGSWMHPVLRTEREFGALKGTPTLFCSL